MQQHVQFACTVFVQNVLSFWNIRVNFSHINIIQNHRFERYVWSLNLKTNRHSTGKTLTGETFCVCFIFSSYE